MKLFKILSLIVFVCVMVGAVLPALISAKSHEAVILGFVIILAGIYFGADYVVKLVQKNNKK